MMNEDEQGEPQEEKKIDIFAKLREMVEAPLDEEKVTEDIFYDILSSSGYSRSDVDEMELKPWELDLDEWTEAELLEFIRKWLGKVTHYFIEMHDNEDGSKRVEFHNAVQVQLMGYVAVSEKAKKLKEDVDQEVTKVTLPQPYGHSLEWVTDTVITVANQIPKMKVPELDGPLRGI